MSFFNSPAPSWSNLTNHMNAKVRSHVLNVYGHLTQMLIVSSLSAYAFLTDRIPVFLAQSPLLALIGTVGCACKFISKKSHFSSGFLFHIACKRMESKALEFWIRGI